MTRTYAPISISLPPDLLRALDAAAEAEDRPRAAMIRRILAAWLKEQASREKPARKEAPR